jgi:RNA polymerase sigma-70 factor, ECF subfamily
MKDNNQLANDTAQRVARASYGKLIAFLAKRTQDVAAAEDALSEAFAAALDDWPRAVPDNPEAWLMAAAKRKIIDSARKRQTRSEGERHLVLLQEELDAVSASSADIPDERLGLMFACAHPAIDAEIRSPLMLQAVLGLDAAAIASAFLITPAAMGQRLARAKQKIKKAGISLRVPETTEMTERLDGVLEAVYAGFAQGWNEASALTEEAIWLGRVVVSLLPEQPEVLGLLALMLFLHSRRRARRTAEGDYVPLSEQDEKRWYDAEISEAENLLHRASAYNSIGRYQLEAAIQSVHTSRRFTGVTDWLVIAQLYDGLYEITHSPVVAINRAVAIAELHGPYAALATMKPFENHLQFSTFQPYHAVRAELLSRSGAICEAIDAYNLAIGLSVDEAVRQYLLGKRAVLVKAN